MKNKKMNVGDEFQTTTLKNEKGGMPIVNINGVVGFFPRDTKELIVPNQVWIVRVVEVKEKFVIVEPLIKIFTAQENYIIGQNRITEMVEKIKTEKQAKKLEKKEAQKRMFQFKTKNEIIKNK